MKIFSRRLWNLTVQYRIRNSPPLVTIHSQINPVHTHTHTPLRSILMLSLKLVLGQLYDWWAGMEVKGRNNQI